MSYLLVNVAHRCVLVSFKCYLRPLSTTLQPTFPFRTDAKQDYEHLSLGTPPALVRQDSLGRRPSSTGRHTDDEGPLRRRAVKVGG